MLEMVSQIQDRVGPQGQVGRVGRQVVVDQSTQILEGTLDEVPRHPRIRTQSRTHCRRNMAVDRNHSPFHTHLCPYYFLAFAH